MAGTTLATVAARPVMTSPATVLIVAPSGRALATSARRGGFVPLIADFFGDQDTLAQAHAHRRLPSGPSIGMQVDEVVEALEGLSLGREPVGVVCGSGFEDRPSLLAEIARRWRLIGNAADVVARVKDPIMLAELCRDCGIPHPSISLARPADANGWLMKRHGGAGGQHVKTEFGDHSIEKHYVQRRVPGTPVGALILANRLHARVLGFSAQWPSPAADQPFRYGGAVTPAPIARSTADALAQAVQRLIALVPLVGLNSVDFLVDGNEFWLLEINPRPGATLDIFEPEDGSLFARHVDACRGLLEARPAARNGARAGAIVYAEQDIVVPALEWPGWVADRSHAGTFICAGDPLCTVRAAAATADEARRLVARRREAILARMCEKAA